jgi:formylmethanofuran dehydrogenase subunit D
MVKIKVTLISGRTSQQGVGLEVATSHGSVVVAGRISKGLDEGVAFFPYGPWANQVFGSETDGTGMPAYKGVEATLEPAKGEVPSLAELVEKLREGAP